MVLCPNFNMCLVFCSCFAVVIGHLLLCCSQFTFECDKVLEKEPKDFPRKVLEAIHIRKKGPNLNRDKGLDLDPVWDNLINPTKTRGARTDHL